MPQDLRCGQCALKFSLGGFHHHRLASGYGGMRLMVCTACGTQHGLQVALRDRGPEFYEIQRVIVEHVPQPVPPVLVSWIRNKRKLSLADALALARNPPFVLDERTSGQLVERTLDELARAHISARTEVVELERNPIFGPLRVDRLLAADGPSEAERHASPMNREQALDGSSDDARRDDHLLSCLHCHSQGTLISEAGFDDQLKRKNDTVPCPRCKAAALVAESFWIT